MAFEVPAKAYLSLRNPGDPFQDLMPREGEKKEEWEDRVTEAGEAGRITLQQAARLYAEGDKVYAQRKGEAGPGPGPGPGLGPDEEAVLFEKPTEPPIFGFQWIKTQSRDTEGKLTTSWRQGTIPSHLIKEGQEVQPDGNIFYYQYYDDAQGRRVTGLGQIRSPEEPKPDIRFDTSRKQWLDFTNPYNIVALTPPPEAPPEKADEYKDKLGRHLRREPGETEYSVIGTEPFESGGSIYEWDIDKGELVWKQDVPLSPQEMDIRAQESWQRGEEWAAEQQERKRRADIEERTLQERSLAGRRGEWAEAWKGLKEAELSRALLAYTRSQESPYRAYEGARGGPHVPLLQQPGGLAATLRAMAEAGYRPGSTIQEESRLAGLPPYFNLPGGGRAEFGTPEYYALAPKEARGYGSPGLSPEQLDVEALPTGLWKNLSPAVQRKLMGLGILEEDIAYAMRATTPSEGATLREPGAATPFGSPAYKSWLETQQAYAASSPLAQARGRVREQPKWSPYWRGDIPWTEPLSQEYSREFEAATRGVLEAEEAERRQQILKSPYYRQAKFREQRRSPFYQR